MFLGAPAGFAGVPVDRAAVAGRVSHGFGEIAVAQLHARAHVEEGQLIKSRLPVLEGAHTSFAEVIGVKEFTHGAGADPAGNCRSAVFHPLMEATD